MMWTYNLDPMYYMDAQLRSYMYDVDVQLRSYMYYMDAQLRSCMYDEDAHFRYLPDNIEQQTVHEETLSWHSLIHIYV